MNPAHTRRKLVATTGMALVALCLLIPGESRPAPPKPQPDHIVFPTGEWPDDVENIQAAVDLGGTVLLKANDASGKPTPFNFGAGENNSCKRQIGLTRDVELLGESVGIISTTITGGIRPIQVGRSNSCAQDFSPEFPKVRIDGITFKGQIQAAIDVYKAADTDIVRNRIINLVVEREIAVGINVFGGGAERRIAGKVTIADNIIRYPASSGTFVHAIVVADLTTDVDLVRNRIETTQAFTGILVVRQAEGKVRIANNFIAPHPQEPGPGDGIGIYIYANDQWNDIRSSPPVYEVTNNRVVSSGWGIGLVGEHGSIDAPVIEQNHISLTGPSLFPDGIGLYGNVSAARVSNNRIDGTGYSSIGIIAFQAGQTAESNAIVGNNLATFLASAADVFLDEHTRGNVLVGYSGTVIDLGSANQITGMHRIGHGQNIGRRLGGHDRSP